MQDVEQPGQGRIELPAMRAQVYDSLRSLSDVDHQRLAWGQASADGSFDDLSLNIHILYDDCEVLPDPTVAVPAVLRPQEVGAFRHLEAALGPLLDDLRDRPDADYLGDPRWKEVVLRAGAALEAMSATSPNVEPDRRAHVRAHECFPSEWPLFADVQDPVFGVVFTTPRLGPDETTGRALSRLVDEVAARIEGRARSAREPWVVDAYVWLAPLAKPGSTRALLARRNAVWAMLEAWGVHVPPGERFEVDTSKTADVIHFAGGLRFPLTSLPDATGLLALEGAEESVLVARPLPAASLTDCLADLTEARPSAGRVRAKGAASGIALFGGESDDQRSFELYALSRQRAFIDRLAEPQ